jgi:uncharacterized membrane protein
MNVSEEHVASIFRVEVYIITSMERQYYAKVIPQKPAISRQWGYSTPCPFY